MLKWSLWLLLVSTVSLAQGDHFDPEEPPVPPWVLTGRVVGELGQAIEGARVEYSDRVAFTTEDGVFKLQFNFVPKGDGWVRVVKTGFAEKAFPEIFKAGTTTTVRYVLPKATVMETRVEGSRLLPAVPEPDKTPQVSRTQITRADIDRIPGALEDVARVVQSVPGVSADPDLLATFFVRGGGPDEVVFYLDGVPLANPYHLGGFFVGVQPDVD